MKSVTRLIKLALWILPVSVVYVFSSCSQEEQLSGRTTASLKVQTRSGSNVLAGEHTVNKLRVLIYNSDDGLEFNDLFEGADIQSIVDGYLIDKVIENIPSGTKTFCLIANETDVLSAGLSSGDQVATLSALQNSDLTWDQSPGLLKVNNLPFAYTQRVRLVSGNNDLELELASAVGRLDFRICRDESLTGSSVEIKSVQILRAVQASRLLDGNPLSWQPEQLISMTEKKDFPDNGVIPSGTGEFLDVGFIAYLYEFETTIPDDATAIKVVIGINGEEVSGTFPLLCGNNGLDKIYGARRNTLTRLSLTAFRDKFVVNTEDLDWNSENKDIEFAEEGVGGNEENITGETEGNDRWEGETQEVEFE